MPSPLDHLLSSITSQCPRLKAEETAYLVEGMSVIELRQKEVYLAAGTVQRALGFVHSGLLRAFYVDAQGREISVRFIPEGHYATHYSAFLAQTPSRYTFQCMERSCLVSLPFEHIASGYDRFPGLERYGRLVAEGVVKAQQQRIEGFLFENPEERYRRFVADEPELFRRISLSALASYLGIERQSLTRIRKRISGLSD